MCHHTTRETKRYAAPASARDRRRELDLALRPPDPASEERRSDASGVGGSSTAGTSAKVMLVGPSCGGRARAERRVPISFAPGPMMIEAPSNLTPTSHSTATVGAGTWVGYARLRVPAGHQGCNPYVELGRNAFCEANDRRHLPPVSECIHPVGEGHSMRPGRAGDPPCRTTFSHRPRRGPSAPSSLGDSE
jgi:hypothetical protein